jgi:uncharacterized protein (DUF2461 family)
MPDSKTLKKIRKKIDTKYKALDDIVNDKEFKKMFPEGLSSERMLKTSPRDYSSDHPGLEYLNHKDFTVFKSLSDKEVLEKNFEDKVVDICKQIAKLNEFLYLN